MRNTVMALGVDALLAVNTGLAMADATNEI